MHDPLSQPRRRGGGRQHRRLCDRHAVRPRGRPGRARRAQPRSRRLQGRLHPLPAPRRRPGAGAARHHRPDAGRRGGRERHPRPHALGLDPAADRRRLPVPAARLQPAAVGARPDAAADGGGDPRRRPRARPHRRRAEPARRCGRPRLARRRPRRAAGARPAARAVQLLRPLPRRPARRRPRVADVDARARRRLRVPERRRPHRPVRDAVRAPPARVPGRHGGQLRARLRGPAGGPGPRPRPARLADHGQGLDAERHPPGIGPGPGARRRRGDGLRPTVGRRLRVRAPGLRVARRPDRAEPRQRAAAGGRPEALPAPAPRAAGPAPPADVRLLDRAPLQPGRAADVPRGRARPAQRGPLRGLRRPLDQRRPLPLAARAR